MAPFPAADILTQQDLARLINSFYVRVRADALLGPVFAARIPAGQWPIHFDTMTRFWTAALLAQPAGYRGNPAAKHLFLPIEAAHFVRWLTLFGQTVDEQFAGPRASEIKLRARKMGELFQMKIAAARANSGPAIL